MKKYKGFAISLFLISSLIINAQEYNPYLSNGSISPSPLLTAEAGGGGVLAFTIGNSGADTLNILSGNRMTVTVELFFGEPDDANPLSALGGSAANLFSWEYDNGRYTGTQTAIMLPGYSGTITVGYRVTRNSTQDNPGNGFSATINPGPYQDNPNQDDSIEILTWTECPAPPAPVIGTVIQPSCEVSTGSVTLGGLPATGTWELIRYPGEVTTTGTGSTVTVTGLDAGTYSFTVTSATGCISNRSGNVVINQPASLPSAPSIGTITQPTCETSTGSVVINGLPAGTWTLTRNPGNIKREGSGSSITDTNLEPGTYSYTVTNSTGCTSPSSGNVQILTSATPPPTPVVRIDCLLGSGFGIVTVIQPTTAGLEYRIDDGPFFDTRTFFGVSNGLHTITVRNSAGCVTTGSPFSVSCGCVNRPSVTLDSRTGTACGTSPLTVSGNTFGGSATSVAITEDGAGMVSPANVTSSPFSFTYTPALADGGRTITITFTTNNPIGSPCTEAIATFTLTVNPVPAAPVPGNVTHPTCTSSTGTIVLNGLPGSGNWTLIRNPGNVTTTGSGSTATIAGIVSGTYTFTVSVSGCVSALSAPVQINAQPPVPSAPVAGNIVQPTCTVPTGSITLNGLPSGSWTLVRFPGTVSISGSGSSAMIPALAPGTYNFTVTGAGGCASPASANIVISAQPPTPQVPVAGAITAPTCTNPEGRVVLSGLPTPGNWTVNSIPAGISQSGNGTSASIRGLSAGGTYVFTVTNSAGCVSGTTANVTIPQIPNAPVLMITNPAPVCSPATVDITNASITAGSTAGLTYTYWTNAATTVPYGTPARATNGTYYIKGTNQAECSDIEVVTVTIRQSPVADAGPDQDLNYAFSAVLAANQPATGERGTWSVLSGPGRINDASVAGTTVTELGLGENIFLWTVANEACTPAVDTVRIIVRDLTVPTLITPNEDGRNDYFRLEGIELMTGNDLVIFDRRGVVVYRNNDYKNDWNGVDYNDKPLPPDTYFYVLKTGNGRSRSGYIVIRR